MIEEIKIVSLEELKTVPKSAYHKCFELTKCIISEGITLKSTI